MRYSVFLVSLILKLRNRSTVESASKDILQTIHMQIDPVLTNLLLKCYELFGMVETEMSSQKAGRSSVIHVTECSTTQILQKLNELASFIAWIENVMLKVRYISLTKVSMISLHFRP